MGPRRVQHSCSSEATSPPLWLRFHGAGRRLSRLGTRLRMVNPTNWKDYTSWPRTRRHVCVSGVIEEKGRENGREKRTPKTQLDQRWETFVDFTTRGSSEVKSTCILRWPRVPTSASVSIKAHLVSRIHTQEQDTGCPSLENRGWWVKGL